MNPKQIACVVLMSIIGAITYFGQIIHKKVVAMKASAESAVADAKAAQDANQLTEILLTKTKAETEDLRRFLRAWTPSVQKVQTEQEMEAAIEYTLRERNISLVKSRKSESRPLAVGSLIPKMVISTIVIEDEYDKVVNWFGDIEKRLPLSRVISCQMTGGSSVRQVQLDVTIESPLVNIAVELGPKIAAAKKK